MANTGTETTKTFYTAEEIAKNADYWEVGIDPGTGFSIAYGTPVKIRIDGASRNQRTWRHLQADDAKSCRRHLARRTRCWTWTCGRAETEQRPPSTRICYATPRDEDGQVVGKVGRDRGETVYPGEGLR